MQSRWQHTLDEKKALTWQKRGSSHHWERSTARPYDCTQLFLTPYFPYNYTQFISLVSRGVCVCAHALGVEQNRFRRIEYLITTVSRDHIHPLFLLSLVTCCGSLGWRLPSREWASSLSFPKESLRHSELNSPGEIILSWQKHQTLNCTHRKRQVCFWGELDSHRGK